MHSISTNKSRTWFPYIEPRHTQKIICSGPGLGTASAPGTLTGPLHSQPRSTYKTKSRHVGPGIVTSYRSKRRLSPLVAPASPSSWSTESTGRADGGNRGARRRGSQPIRCRHNEPGGARSTNSIWKWKRRKKACLAVWMSWHGIFRKPVRN